MLRNNWGFLQLVVLYVDFKLDESYTPSKVSIRAGDGFHNLKVIHNFQDFSPNIQVLIILNILLWLNLGNKNRGAR